MGLKAEEGNGNRTIGRSIATAQKRRSGDPEVNHAHHIVQLTTAAQAARGECVRYGTEREPALACSAPVS